MPRQHERGVAIVDGGGRQNQIGSIGRPRQAPDKGRQARFVAKGNRMLFEFQVFHYFGLTRRLNATQFVGRHADLVHVEWIPGDALSIVFVGMLFASSLPRTILVGNRRYRMIERRYKELRRVRRPTKVCQVGARHVHDAHVQIGRLDGTPRAVFRQGPYNDGTIAGRRQTALMGRKGYRVDATVVTRQGLQKLGTRLGNVPQVHVGHVGSSSQYIATQRETGETGIDFLVGFAVPENLGGASLHGG